MKYKAHEDLCSSRRLVEKVVSLSCATQQHARLMIVFLKGYGTSLNKLLPTIIRKINLFRRNVFFSSKYEKAQCLSSDPSKFHKINILVGPR